MRQPSFDRARALRAALTDVEKIMWRLLRQGELSALNFRRQAPFGEYILDFVSHPARLVVEVDGSQHAEPVQAAHDERRTAFLNSQGYRVLRFWNHEAKCHQDGVCRAIHAAAMGTPARTRMERWRKDNERAYAMWAPPKTDASYEDEAPALPSMGRAAAERPGGVIGADGGVKNARGAPPESHSSLSAPITPPGARSASADLPIEGRLGASFCDDNA